jgi:hypothetical protein
MMDPSVQMRDTLPQRVRRQPSVRKTPQKRQHVKFACFPRQKKKTKVRFPRCYLHVRILDP